MQKFEAKPYLKVKKNSHYIVEQKMKRKSNKSHTEVKLNYHRILDQKLGGKLKVKNSLNFINKNPKFLGSNRIQR